MKDWINNREAWGGRGLQKTLAEYSSFQAKIFVPNCVQPLLGHTTKAQ